MAVVWNRLAHFLKRLAHFYRPKKRLLRIFQNLLNKFCIFQNQLITIGTPISKSYIPTSLFPYELQIIILKKIIHWKNKKRLSTITQKNKKRLYKIAKSETIPFFTAFLTQHTACMQARIVYVCTILLYRLIVEHWPIFSVLLRARIAPNLIPSYKNALCGKGFNFRLLYFQSTLLNFFINVHYEFFNESFKIWLKNFH